MGLVLALILLVFIGFFAYNNFIKPKHLVLQEIDLAFDPNGPYALLTPRRDGNAVVLNIKRVSSYSAISYELTYQSEGIDRGVQGTLNTKDKKAEYTQEILFGTCSTTDTFNINHCVFDKNVENGTLILRIQKDDKLYKMVTNWHFQRPDVALGLITSADTHFVYKAAVASESSKVAASAIPQELVVVGYSIVNDLTGVPKVPDGKEVLGKVYGFNVPSTRVFPKGEVSIELADNPPADAKIARFDFAKDQWQLLETKVSGSTLKTSAEGTGIFAVLINISSHP